MHGARWYTGGAVTYSHTDFERALMLGPRTAAELAYQLQVSVEVARYRLQVAVTQGVAVREGPVYRHALYDLAVAPPRMSSVLDAVSACRWSTVREVAAVYGRAPATTQRALQRHRSGGQLETTCRGKMVLWGRVDTCGRWA